MRMCMCNKNGNVFIFCHVVTLKNDNKREGIISIQLKGRPRGLCNDICDNSIRFLPQYQCQRKCF